jgi:hypothetical protein
MKYRNVGFNLPPRCRFQNPWALFVRPRLITPSALRGQAKITPEHLSANFPRPPAFYQGGCPTSDAGDLSMFERSQNPYKNMVIDGLFWGGIEIFTPLYCK